MYRSRSVSVYVCLYASVSLSFSLHGLAPKYLCNLNLRPSLSLRFVPFDLLIGSTSLFPYSELQWINPDPLHADIGPFLSLWNRLPLQSAPSFFPVVFPLSPQISRVPRTGNASENLILKVGLYKWSNTTQYSIDQMSAWTSLHA